MLAIAVRTVNRPVPAGLEGHLRFLATAGAGRAECLPRATVGTVGTTLGLARRAAVWTATRWVVEASAGVILLLADTKDKWLPAITAGQRRIRGHLAAVPQVNGPPLARQSSEWGFRRNQRNRLFS